jgi:hypothetical protein
MAARRPRLLSPTAFLRRSAVYKGLLGGSRGWLAVGAVFWLPRLLKRLFGRTEEVVATEKLVAGEFVRLEAVRPPTRRERRAGRRSGR